MKDTDFLFLTSLLRAREVRMLGQDKIDRMLDSPGFPDAAKMLLDCGYPDMSDMNMTDIDSILEKHRSDAFAELSGFGYALDVLNLFRIKYDYHNVKVLVKSMGVHVNADHLLSASGRVDIKVLSDAHVLNQLGDLPPYVAAAIESATGILSRTGNPQLSDIEIDKAYFSELSSISSSLKETFIKGYVRLLIDSANLRTIVRSARVGRGNDFLLSALIEGGSVSIEQLFSSFSESAASPLKDEYLEHAVSLSYDAMKGGDQTVFELACDNAILRYVTNTLFIGFGPAPIMAYLAKLEWEITVVRMILTGKYTGISSDVIRERLRECHV